MAGSPSIVVAVSRADDLYFIVSRTYHLVSLFSSKSYQFATTEMISSLSGGIILIQNFKYNMVS